MPTEGLEPPHLAAHGPEPCASTNSATWALTSSTLRCGVVCNRGTHINGHHRIGQGEINNSEKMGTYPIFRAAKNRVRPHFFDPESGKQKSRFSAAFLRNFWCPRRDSNPHTSRHMDLNHARLPIPPRGHFVALFCNEARIVMAGVPAVKTFMKVCLFDHVGARRTAAARRPAWPSRRARGWVTRPNRWRPWPARRCR